MNYLAEHQHISEREPDGSWEDCTWDAGLEWYRLCFDTSKPATHAEAQALRAASGEPPTGGSNIADFRRGVLKRYGVTLPPALSVGFAGLWSALQPGTAALVQGSMKAFGPAHRLSRYDRNFDGGHAVMVVRMNDSSSVWWCDPEGPRHGYNGEWVTKAELERFVRAFNGQHLVAKVGPPKTQADIDAAVAKAVAAAVAPLNARIAAAKTALG